MLTIHFRRGLMGLLLAFSAIPTAWPTVYYSKEEALELAFGSGAEIETISVFLTDEQAANIEQMAKAKLDSKLFTFYAGKRDGAILGYAAIESHTVRTQPETLLVCLSPEGDLTRLEILAFHEPPEYQPPVRWFERLYRRPIEQMTLGHGIDGIAGATLSSQAAVDGARKLMAIYRGSIKQEKH